MSYRKPFAAVSIVITGLLWQAAAASWAQAPPGPAAAQAASAQPGPQEPEDPQLAALIEEALASSPELLGAQAAAEAALERPAQAQGLADPMFSLGYTNDGWAFSLGEQPMTRLELMASQSLPWPGKRDLRGRVAESEALAVQAGVARARLSLEASVRRAYADLLLARQLLSLVAEEAEALREIEGVTLARYGVGQGAQQDVLRAQTEVTRVEQKRIEQATNERLKLAQLNQLLARAPEATLGPGIPLALEPETRALAELQAAAIERSPELRAAAALVERERLASELARLDFKPDFALQAGYMNRGGLDPMWQAGVGVNLPVYRKKREAALAESQARLRGAERRVESLRLLLRLRTEERAALLRSLEEQAALFVGGVIPQDEMSVEAALANYRAGKLPFIAVLEALGGLYGDRGALLRLLAAHSTTRASLEEASLAATPTPSFGGGTGLTAGSSGSQMSAGMER
jgi:cobalt-zinc-cadmium efflux system outer membrane protein